MGAFETLLCEASKPLNLFRTNDLEHLSKCQSHMISVDNALFHCNIFLTFRNFNGLYEPSKQCLYDFHLILDQLYKLVDTLLTDLCNKIEELQLLVSNWPD